MGDAGLVADSRRRGTPWLYLGLRTQERSFPFPRLDRRSQAEGSWGARAGRPRLFLVRGRIRVPWHFSTVLRRPCGP